MLKVYIQKIQKLTSQMFKRDLQDTLLNLVKCPRWDLSNLIDHFHWSIRHICWCPCEGAWNAWACMCKESLYFSSYTRDSSCKRLLVASIGKISRDGTKGLEFKSWSQQGWEGLYVIFFFFLNIVKCIFCRTNHST